MSALQAYNKIRKAANILICAFLLNNLISVVSGIALIYFIWWRWHLGLFGIIFFIFALLIINSVILRSIFAEINRPFAEMARQGAVRLAVIGAINEGLVRELAKIKVEHWPETILKSMTQEEFNRKILLNTGSN